MRKFRVSFYDNRMPAIANVVLNENEKANPDVFAEKINEFYDRICEPDMISAWSLIEE